MRLYDISEGLKGSAAVPAVRQKIEVVDFRSSHVIALAPERLEDARRWERIGPGWTMLVDGIPIAAIGLAEHPKGVADLWGLCHLLRHQAFEIKRRFHFEVKKRLQALPYRRIQILVDKNDRVAVKWAIKLGFICETPDCMRAWDEGGAELQLWARVR